MLLCLRGGRTILLSMIVVGIAGCGGILNNGIRPPSDLPPSNIQTAETVLLQALETSGIDGGNGSQVMYSVEGRGAEIDLLSAILPEFLLDAGYSVMEKGISLPEIRFHIDTLFVNLDVERVEHSGKILKRYSEARIGAVIMEPSGMKRVYSGNGRYEDTVPFHLKETVCTDESFVNDFTDQTQLIKRIKPFVYGVIMTSMAWFFYSYRG